MSMSPSRHVAIAALLTAILPAATQAAVFTVGSQTNCTHANVQAALNAAAGLPDEASEIRLTAGLHPVATVTAGAANVAIRGGFADCSASPARSGRSILRGNGAATVLRVDASTDSLSMIVLERLDITAGASVSASGGAGILATGRFLLRLQDVDVHANQSTAGGAGISAIGPLSGEGGVVELLRGTRIRLNLAPIGGNSHGGGIRLERAVLRVRSDDVQIVGNQARFGGAVAVLGQGSVYVGSVGEPAEATVTAGAAITGNRAHDGGGLWLSGDASLDAHELAIEGNIADSQGGGLYGGDGVRIALQRDYSTGPGVRCPAEAPCSRLVGNRAGDGCPGIRGDGGAVALAVARATIRQTLIADNCAYGSPVLRTFGPELELEGVVIRGNRLRKRDGVDVTGYQMITLGSRAGAQAYVAQLRHITAYGNLQVDATGSSSSAPNFIATNSDAGAVLAGSALDGRVSASLLASGSCNRSELGAAAFVDAAAGDLRPASFGPLIDACPTGAVATATRDLLLGARCRDLLDVPDVGGLCDIGAIEVAETIATTTETTSFTTLSYRQANLGTPFRLSAFLSGERRVPTGDVVMALSSGERCVATLVASGVRSARADCEVTPGTIGVVAYSASYAGSSTHGASRRSINILLERALVGVRVLAAAPSVALVGDPVALRVALSSAANSLTGSVELSAGAAGQCRAELMERHAECGIRPVVAGAFAILASYGGDASNLSAEGTSTDGGVRVQGEADLSVAIDNGATRIARGQPVDYLISVRNDGPDDAFDARLRFTPSEPALMQELTCLDRDAGARCGLDNGNDDVALLSLPSATAATLQLTVVLAPGTAPFSVEAGVTPAIAGTDPLSGNNRASDGPDATTATSLLLRDGFEQR